MPLLLTYLQITALFYVWMVFLGVGGRVLGLQNTRIHIKSPDKDQGFLIIDYAAGAANRRARLLQALRVFARPVFWISLERLGFRSLEIKV